MRAGGNRGRGLALLAAMALLAACGSRPPASPPPQTKVVVENHGTLDQPRAPRSPYAPAQEDLSKRGDYTAGGLYAPGVRDSAPEGGIPDVHLIPEPEVRAEPRSRYGNRSPYKVLGKSYRVRDSAEGYREVGIASYYGNKFHGRRTSNLEVYDMYAFTAAHKTLPLPSFARVTNLSNRKSVVVRVNDRGPFHDGRIIDLSYAAAVKIGLDRAGTAKVEVVGLGPGGREPGTGPAVAAQLPPATPVPGVFLQVASFGTRENAERALAMLGGAGILNARLVDAEAGGRRVWRLHVGPIAPDAAAELGSRLQALGFGVPQAVRE